MGYINCFNVWKPIYYGNNSNDSIENNNKYIYFVLHYARIGLKWKL